MPWSPVKFRFTGTRTSELTPADRREKADASSSCEDGVAVVSDPAIDHSEVDVSGRDAQCIKEIGECRTICEFDTEGLAGCDVAAVLRQRSEEANGDCHVSLPSDPSSAEPPLPWFGAPELQLGAKYHL